MSSSTNQVKTGDGPPPDLLSLSPDGRSLITGRRDRSLQWWDLPHGTNVALDAEAYRVLFTRDGKYFATLSRGTNVHVWDSATRTIVSTLSHELNVAFAGAFSFDGAMLAVVATDDTVRLWDFKKQKMTGIFSGHKQGIFALCFAPDGKTLATGSDDSTVKLWNVATQQELMSFRRQGDSTRTLTCATVHRTAIRHETRPDLITPVNSPAPVLWAVPRFHFKHIPELSCADVLNTVSYQTSEIGISWT